MGNWSNYRVEFKRPDSAGRMRRVCTFRIARNERQAAAEVRKEDLGAKVISVTACAI